MLSLHKYREILDTKMDDDSLRQLVAQLYDVAEAVVDLALQSPPMNPQNCEFLGTGIPLTGTVAEYPFEEASKPLTADQKEEVVERAAIMEYDGRRPRDEAERYALGRVLKGPNEQ